MEPADDDRHIAWLRELVRDMKPFTTGGVYLNFSPEGQEHLLDGYGPEKYARLVALKEKYDPAKRVPFQPQRPAARGLAGRSVFGSFSCRSRLLDPPRQVVAEGPQEGLGIERLGRSQRPAPAARTP
jgi:hypothetical protein